MQIDIYIGQFDKSNVVKSWASHELIFDKPQCEENICTETTKKDVFFQLRYSLHQSQEHAALPQSFSAIRVTA